MLRFPRQPAPDTGRAPPAQVDYLRRLAAAQRLEVQGMSTEDVRALSGILDEAKHQVGAAMKDWIARGAGNELRWTAQSARAALVMLDEVSRAVEERTLHVADGRVDPLVKLGVATASGSLARIKRQLLQQAPQFGGSIRSLAVREAAVTASGRKLVTARFANSAARYAGNVRNDLQRVLAIDILTGAPLRQTIQKLVDHGGPRGKVFLRGREGTPGSAAEVISDGLFRRYESWADRWARTEYSNAFNVVNDEGLRDIGDQVGAGAATKVWLTAPHCCKEICADLDGQVVGVDKSFHSSIVGELEHPPAHPYCRCTTALQAVDWHKVDWARVERGAAAAPPPAVQAPPAPPPPPPPSRPAPPPPARPSAPPPAPVPVPAAAPAGPPAFDVGKLSPALDAPGPAAAQAEIRDQLRLLVEKYGMEDVDRHGLGNTYEAQPNYFARGTHDGMGRIVIGKDVHDEAAAAARRLASSKTPLHYDQAQALRTLVHETAHGASAMTMTSYAVYSGAGMVVEEVGTEIAARAVMRREFGPRLSPAAAAAMVPGAKAGSYQKWISPMRELVAKTLGVPLADADKLLEAASIGARAKGNLKSTSVAEHVKKFVGAMPIKGPKAPTLRQDLEKAILGYQWPA